MNIARTFVLRYAFSLPVGGATEDRMSIEEEMRLTAEWRARVQPEDRPPADDLGPIARGLGWFARPSEHEHRLRLERGASRR